MVMVSFVLTAIVTISTVSTLNDAELPYNSKISHAKHAAAFDRLLSSIAKVNQQRLDSIKKLNRLQELKLTELRTDKHDRESSSSEERDIIYLVIPETGEAHNTGGHRLPDTTRTSDDRNTSQPTNQPTQPSQRINSTTKPHILGPLRHHNMSDAYIAPRTKETPHMNISTDGLEFLRQSIARSCSGKDVKRCTKACKEAIRSGCAAYDCRNKLKKILKKKCKKACKEEFKGGW